MDDKVLDLLEVYDERLRAGRLSDHDRMDSTCLAPQIRRQVEEAQACLRLIHRVRRSRTVNRPRDARSDRQPLAAGTCIGRFEIIKELGQGGHGIVFLAWDPVARRNVALKVPHPAALFTPELRDRFLREGIAAARLAHRNIVPVLDVDQSGPVCYIVSAYGRGRSLAIHMAARGRPLAADVAARWVAELADGAEHAHRLGILHRDLKPGNVLVEPATLSEDSLEPADVDQAREDELVPKLTDFGLAKLSDSHDLRTHTGLLLGTPAYMAPEQVDGSFGPITTATDIYGLGTILYELLTGSPPFPCQIQADLLRQIAGGQLRQPREIRPDLPADLEAICLRALERVPRNRYGSAAELAADLRRFLAGEVTHARPLGRLGRVAKWSMRRPAVAMALSISAVAAITLLSGAVWHVFQIDRARQVAEDARERAESSESQLRELIYFRDMQETHRAIEERDVLKAGAVLARYKAHTSPGKPGFLWRYLRARATGEPMAIAGHMGHAHSVDFSPDGASAASAGADGTVRLWSVDSGRLLTSLPSGAAEANHACFNPRGDVLAAAGSDARVRLWETKSGRVLATWPCELLQNINWLAWTPDGEQLLAAGWPGSAALRWNVATGRVAPLPLSHTEEVNALAISPDGKLLASASSDGTVQIQHLDTGLCVVRLTMVHMHVRVHVRRARFSPDGQFLATAGTDGMLKVWRTATWQEAAAFATGTNRVSDVVFDPTRRALIFSDDLGVIRAWDWLEDRLLTVIDSGVGRALALAISPDGQRWSIAAADGSLRIWDRRNLEPVVRRAMAPLSAFTKDGRHLVTADSEGNLGVFELDRDRFRLVDRPAGSDGTLTGLVTAGKNEVAWLRRKGFEDSLLRWSPGEQGELRGTVLQGLPDASVVAATSGGRFFCSDEASPFLLCMWDSEGGHTKRELGSQPNRASSMACSPQEDLLAVGHSNGAISIWDLHALKLILHFPAHVEGVNCLSFDATGQQLASGGGDRLVRFWNPRSGKPSPLVLAHPSRVTRAAFCPDERLLATGDGQGCVRLWSLVNGEEVLRLGDLPKPVVFLGFSPDGRCLAASGGVWNGDHELRFWKAPGIARPALLHSDDSPSGSNDSTAVTRP